jgi:homoserine kinase
MTARIAEPTVRAFAPATVANLGAGLDILGCAVTGAGDTVIASRVDESGITIVDAGHPELSTNPDRNTAGIAAREVLRYAGFESVGVRLTVEKGLPLSGGQGGSAASATASAVAVNALLGSPLGTSDLLDACLAAEETVAGRHADNIAPCLMGGLVLVRSLDPPDVVRLPTPDDLRIVVAHPAYRMRTADARTVLPEHIDCAVALAQAADVAATVSALASGDYALLRRAVRDRIAEPVRAPLLPGFREAQEAALRAGACGSSISGAGPTTFALAQGDAAADGIASAMREAYSALGIACNVRVARVDQLGARVVRSPEEP